jgi:hypothetical protein
VNILTSSAVHITRVTFSHTIELLKSTIPLAKIMAVLMSGCVTMRGYIRLQAISLSRFVKLKLTSIRLLYVLYSNVSKFGSNVGCQETSYRCHGGRGR